MKKNKMDDNKQSSRQKRIKEKLGGPLALYRYLGTRYPLFLQRNIRKTVSNVIYPSVEEREQPAAASKSYVPARNGVDAKLRFHEIRLRVPRPTFEQLCVPPEPEQEENPNMQPQTESAPASASSNAFEEGKTGTETTSTKKKRSREHPNPEEKVPHNPWCYAVVSFFVKKRPIRSNHGQMGNNAEETGDAPSTNTKEGDCFLIHQHPAVFVPSKPWLTSDAFREYIPHNVSQEQKKAMNKAQKKFGTAHPILSYESSDKMRIEATAMHDISFRMNRPSPVEVSLPKGIPLPRECFRIKYDSVVEPSIPLKEAVSSFVDDDHCVRGTLLSLPSESKVLRSMLRALDGEKYNVVYVNSPDDLCASRNFTYEQLRAPLHGVKRLHIAKFFDCPLDESTATSEVFVRVSLVSRTSTAMFPKRNDNPFNVRVPVPPESIVASVALTPSLSLVRHLNGYVQNTECASRIALLGQLARSAVNADSTSVDSKVSNEKVLDLNRLDVSNSWRAALRAIECTRLKCLGSNINMGQISEVSDSSSFLLKAVPVSLDQTESFISENLSATIQQKLWGDIVAYEQGKKVSCTAISSVVTPSLLETQGCPTFQGFCIEGCSRIVNVFKGRTRCFNKLGDFDWYSNEQNGEGNSVHNTELYACYSIQTLSIRNMVAGVAPKVEQPYKSLLKIGRKAFSYGENSDAMTTDRKVPIRPQFSFDVFQWHFWASHFGSPAAEEWCHVDQNISSSWCALCRKQCTNKDELCAHLITNHYRCSIGVHEDEALRIKLGHTEETLPAVKILQAACGVSATDRKVTWHIHVVPFGEHLALKNELETFVDEKHRGIAWFGEILKKEDGERVVSNSQNLTWGQWQDETLDEIHVRGWTYFNPNPTSSSSTVHRRKKQRAMLECHLSPDSVDKKISDSLVVQNRYPRQYFHSQTGQPIQPQEDDIDSDDDVKDRWILDQSACIIDSFEDASSREKKFMKLWNQHVFELGVSADRVVPRVCLLFARRFVEEIRKYKLRFQFLLHMLTLWDFAILDTRTLHYCMRIVDAYRYADESQPQQDECEAKAIEQ